MFGTVPVCVCVAHMGAHVSGPESMCVSPHACCVSACARVSACGAHLVPTAGGLQTPSSQALFSQARQSLPPSQACPDARGGGGLWGSWSLQALHFPGNKSIMQEEEEDAGD